MQYLARVANMGSIIPRAAEVALDLGIKVLALVPCKGQESQWPLSSQKHYVALLWSIEDTDGKVEYVLHDTYNFGGLAHQ